MLIEPKLVQGAWNEIQDASRILLVSHIRPDGDAIGSLLGLGLSIKAIGKDVSMVSPDGVPRNFRHLAGSEEILNSPYGEYDYICVLDCSDLSRVGKVLENYGTPHLNIDHHKTNVDFAEINIVNLQAVSTTQIIAELIDRWELPWTQEAVSALLSGLITDTIGFRTSNMTSAALRLAANLMDFGADLPDLYRRGLVVRSFESTQLWGAGLQKMERENGLVWTTITVEDREHVMYPGYDDADLINVLVSIDDANIAVIFIEQPDNRIKVSWRSKPAYDISQVAFDFGGGGHPNAAGAEIQGDLELVKMNVLRKTRLILFAEEVI